MADMLLSTLALASVALILIYQYLTWHYNLWNRLALAGPPPKVLVGNFPCIYNGKQNIAYEYDQFYHEYKKSHSVIGVFVTRTPQLVLLDPKLAYDVMVTNFGKFRDNLPSDWIMNREEDKYALRNPFFTTGDEWKSKRADALGGLTVHKLNLAYPIWKESAQKLSKFMRLKTMAGPVVMESKDLAYRFTVNVMGDLLWGIDAGTFENDNKPNVIMQMASVMLKQSFNAVVVYYSTIVLPFVRRFCRNRFFPAETDNFFSQLTKDAVAMRLQDGGSNRIDYLNYMMQLQEKKNLSHDDVMGHIMTVLLDGYETTANVIYHTLFYLAKHEEVQQKLRAEIQNNVDEAGYIPFETLNSLPFLDQCLHETIRLVTPLPSYARICTESTAIEVQPGKHVPIKVGTVLHIPIFSYHHDPDYFPEPYAYKPERFDNAAHVELTKRGIFMPFGIGPRICLGMRTGLLGAKTFLVQMLQEYRISCCSRTMAEKKPDSNSFILGLEGDFWLQYEHL